MSLTGATTYLPNLFFLVEVMTFNACNTIVINHCLIYVTVSLIDVIK